MNDEQRPKKTKFYLGFPLETEGSDKPSNKAKASGVALIISLLMTALIILFLTEMKITSAVANRLSLGNQLNVKAEYIAKSGVNLAIMLITADLAIDLSIREFDKKSFPIDGPADFWGSMNGLPIGGETLELISATQESFELSSISDSSVIDQLKDFDGSFSIEVTDETSRTNLNYCGLGRGNRCIKMFESLLSCPVEQEFIERKRIVVRDLSALVKDYVDINTRPEPFASYSSEEDPYDGYDKDAFPKNANFDSLAELRFIPGWDKDLHAVFSPYLTVFPRPRDNDTEYNLHINYNTVSRELLSCLVPQTYQSCSEPSALYFQQQSENKGSPVNNLASIKESLSRNFCSTDDDIAKYFSFRSDVYRIKVQAQVVDQIRDLEVVVSRGVPDEQDIREDYQASYKYLYWKML